MFVSSQQANDGLVSSLNRNVEMIAAFTVRM